MNIAWFKEKNIRIVYAVLFLLILAVAASYALLRYWQWDFIRHNQPEIFANSVLSEFHQTAKEHTLAFALLKNMPVDTVTYDFLGGEEYYPSYGRDMTYVYNFSNENGLGTVNAVVRVPGANPDSFVVLTTNLAKDKRHVYLGDKAVIGADQNTFHLVNYSADFVKSNEAMMANLILNENQYFADNAHVYFYNRYPETIHSPDGANVFGGLPTLSVIPGADPATFSRMSDIYSAAKDKNAIYYRNQKIEGADYKTYRILENDCPVERWMYGVDKSNVYYGSTRIDGVSPNTFKANGPYGMSGSHVYENGELRSDVDLTTAADYRGCADPL